MPLSVFSNLLASEMDFSEEDKAEYTRIISVNNDLLLQLINDILDISKIEAGVMDFTENTVELNQFFQEIESVFQLKAKTGIEIKFIPEQAEEYAIKIDRIRLNQVISNFLNNALKFTRQGHIFFGYRLREKRYLLLCRRYRNRYSERSTSQCLPSLCQIKQFHPGNRIRPIDLFYYHRQIQRKNRSRIGTGERIDFLVHDSQGLGRKTTVPS